MDTSSDRALRWPKPLLLTGDDTHPSQLDKANDYAGFAQFRLTRRRAVIGPFVTPITDLGPARA